MNLKCLLFTKGWTWPDFIKMGSKVLLVCLLAAPFLNVLYLGFRGQLGANPVEQLILETGQASLMVFLFLLALPRLAKWPGLGTWLLRWVKYSRLIGLTLFGYASLHIAIYGADHLGQWEKLPKELTRPFVVSGLVAWLILLALAVTSNRVSRRILKQGWKKLHRLVWLTLPLLAVHITLKEEGDWDTALLWFSPLLLLLALHRWRQFRAAS